MGQPSKSEKLGFLKLKLREFKITKKEFGYFFWKPKTSALKCNRLDISILISLVIMIFWNSTNQRQKHRNASVCDFYVWLGEFQKFIMIKLIKIAMSSLLHFEAKVFGFPKIEPKYLWVILNSRNFNFKKPNFSLFEGWPTVQF